MVVLVLGVATVPAAAQAPPTTVAPAPSADTEAVAAITVTPDTGLVDEQVVAVEVSGLTPNTEFEVWQCSKAAAPAEGLCARSGVADAGLLGLVRSDAGGTISDDGVAQAVIEAIDGRS